uniref:Uncharacterized protein n=1 Tax=Pipistrellus kuhlii TaxID=59472 RepID=A0A7J7W365_PIPKU|nr:hypothetical protein mPipKuh1_008177 [Pipistrellus kuhlii]
MEMSAARTPSTQGAAQARACVERFLDFSSASPHQALGRYCSSPGFTGEDTESTRQSALPQVRSEHIATLECYVDLGLRIPCSSPWIHMGQPGADGTAWSCHRDMSGPLAFKSSNSTGERGA